MKKNLFQLIIQIVTAVLLVVAIATSVYLYLNLNNVQSELEEMQAQEITQNEFDELMENVGKHIILPENERPLITVISDVEALVTEQPFYNGALENDVLIAYPQAQKAIVYSPDREILVNVGPLYIEQAPTEEAEVTPTQ